VETNELGLTKNEKLLFGFLSIILIVAMGVLIINSLSLNERKLDETLTTEKRGQEVEEVIADSRGNLKEETIDRATTRQVAYASNIKFMRNVEAIQARNESLGSQANVIRTASEIEETSDDFAISTIYQTWDFKEDIVTTAYANDKIKIDEYVLLNDGSEAKAQLTVRKLVDNTYMIVDISSGYLTVSAGKYKYYYTYANVTKELELEVKDNLKPEKVEFLSIKDTLNDTDKEEIDKLKETINASQVTISEEKINLTVEEDALQTRIPVVLTLSKLQEDVKLKSNTYGIRLVKEDAEWYEPLSNNQIIMWIEFAILSTTKTNFISVEINNITYVAQLDIKVRKKMSEEETEYIEPGKVNDKDNNKQENTVREDKNEIPEIKNVKQVNSYMNSKNMQELNILKMS